MHVAVIGGGLAGLAAAEALRRAAPACRVTVFEPSGRAGGVIGTVHQDGWLVERSADCFLAARLEGLALVSRLGLDRELIGVEPLARRALIWHAGRTLPAPAGFRLMAPSRVAGILGTPVLSPVGRLRLLGERLVAARRGGSPGDDESLESFAVRRLGREAFERLVQPLASGIWTADPARLSMAAACPEFLAMEHEWGSLWAGERARLRRQTGGAEAAGARYGQFVTLASGMETLPRRLAEELRCSGVQFIAGDVTGLGTTSGGRWRLNAGCLESGALTVDAVVMAAPAHVAAMVLRGVDSQLAGELAAIGYAGSCIVSLGYARDAVAHPLDAAGMVVPRTAGRRILAASFSSSKFPGRAPEGCVLIRVFIGGALDPGAMHLDDGGLTALARRELGDLLGARGEPRLVRVERWGHAMPQYHVGHLARIARIEALVSLHPGLALAGAAYRGVGIPQVIASGQAAAERCLAAARPA
ncbi:MAG: protoporphyrinogen oxidase [Planctomycetia bacterium]|nr:protoporphyrinogen oxidase [Planctomycetia bacterium]